MMPTLLALALLIAGTPTTPADDFIDRMEVEHAADEPVASPAATEEPAMEVETSEGLKYADLDGTEIYTFLARPKGVFTAPGILVIHEWWGVNDNIRAMARRLAGEGYIVMTVDLYEGEVAEDRETAGRLARRASERRERTEANIRAAYTFLTEKKRATSVGVIGWCFGGGWSLNTALMLGDDIDAAVIYYGRLVTDSAQLAPLTAPVLGLFGDQDRGIPVEGVREFESALGELGKAASIHVYEGAGHAFANPSGTRYDAAAAEDAWAKTVAFFAENLR